MLDDQTRAACIRLEAMARRNGWDLWETLERGGIVLSSDRRAMVERGTVAALLVQLEDIPHTAFPALVNGNQTVTGAVNGVVKFIELFAKGLES